MGQDLRWYNISWTSKKDGPGIRTVLFLSQCNLRCPWCHAPQSWRRHSDLLFYPERCLHCGACESVCPKGVHQVKEGVHTLNRSLCDGCGLCVVSCPTTASQESLCGALALPRFEADPHEVYLKVRPQLELLKRIGGITISGGEPLLQHQALIPLLEACRQSGVHTAIETSASVPSICVEELLERVDCWLFGLRPVTHRRIDAPMPKMVLVESNLKRIAEAGRSRVIIRTPIIPEYTDHPSTLLRIADLMMENHLTEIELMPFNPFSSLYYHALDMEYPLEFGSDQIRESLQSARRFFEGRGFAVKTL